MMGLLTFQKGAPGVIEQGNIDLRKRPQFVNPDGSISTVRSMSIGTDNGEVLIPTISPDGKSWDEQQAIDNFRATGQHLGIFDSVRNAETYAQMLHKQQAKALGLMGR